MTDLQNREYAASLLHRAGLDFEPRDVAMVAGIIPHLEAAQADLANLAPADPAPASLSGATILTADGVYFDYGQPQAAAITLNAIARGLANTCRFAGQCDRFYSVAEHSIWLSLIVPEEHAVSGLFHDAAEAFIGDMPKPLKVVLADYQAVEARVEAVVFAALGLPPTLPPEVKQADRVMLATEQRQLMKNRDPWRFMFDAQPDQRVQLKCLSPEDAYAAFIARARKLGVTLP